MSNIVKIQLPHGRIPIETVPDPTVRDVLRKLNDNIVKLADALSEVKNEQTRGGTV